jgi:hypothetical protein
MRRHVIDVLIVALIGIGLWDATAKGDKILWGMGLPLTQAVLLILAGVLFMVRFFIRRR